MLPDTLISFFIDFPVDAQTRSDLNHTMRVVMNYLEDLKGDLSSGKSSVCGRMSFPIFSVLRRISFKKKQQKSVLLHACKK